MKIENPFVFFNLVIYELFENDHSIIYRETRRKSEVAPLFTHVPGGELFQCGFCQHYDDELMYSGFITWPWHFAFMCKHVKQSSMPKASFDKLL